VKSLLSPSVLATVIGFLLFIAKIMLPSIANKSIGYIAEMNTPLAMLVSGVTIAQTDILSMLKKVRTYYITFLKLLVMPIIMILIFRNFHISRIVMLSSILAVSCPTAVTINLFAIRFDKNYYYAAELFAMTTIMSAFTIPIVMMIAEYLIK
jgi:predicted permease